MNYFARTMRLSTEKWTCVRCKAVNYTMRKTCINCKANRSGVIYDRLTTEQFDELTAGQEDQLLEQAREADNEQRATAHLPLESDELVEVVE